MIRIRSGAWSVGSRGGSRVDEVEDGDLEAGCAPGANHARRAFVCRSAASMKVFITVVDNPDKAGEPPAILGVFRTGEADHFQLGCGGAKSAHRNLFLELANSRCPAGRVGFLAENFYPARDRWTRARAALWLSGSREPERQRPSAKAAAFPETPICPMASRFSRADSRSIAMAR